MPTMILLGDEKLSSTLTYYTLHQERTQPEVDQLAFIPRRCCRKGNLSYALETIVKRYT